MINIKNSSNWKISDKFFKKYADKIEALFPIMKGKTIEIREAADYYCPNNVDYDSPLQEMLKDKDTNLKNDTIIYVNEYPKGQNIINTFTEGELFALLAHELGHIIAYYTKQAVGGLKEEIFADKCAYDLGLDLDMISAIEKMLIIELTKQPDPLNFLKPKPVTNVPAELDLRIQILADLVLKKSKSRKLFNICAIVSLIISITALILATIK